MIDKRDEFATCMFQEIYGTLTDEDGKPYIKVYQYETEELIKDMLFDLNIIINVFRELSVSDISKIFAIHFWDTESIINYDVDNIAFKFDELFGDNIAFR